MGSEPVILDISSDEENGGGCCNRKAAFTSDDDDDDDCVILDGDPDEQVSAENAIGDSDDLVVVGSKGQVACRDFPHPRHLCANYEFGTTPHEKHCGQCHCYVCDELAPCVNWGDGTCILDHCHATDKTEYWKIERKLLKKPDIAPEAPPQVPPPRLTDFNSVPPCSTTGNYTSVINPNPVVGSAPNQTNLPSSQSKNSHRNTSLHHISGMSTTFKRPGGAVLATNGSAYERYSQIFPNQTNLQFSQNCGQLSSTSNEYTSSTTLLDSVNVNTVNPLPFQPSSIYLPESSQSFDHSPSHLNSSDFCQNSMPSEPHTSSLHKGENFVSNSLSYSPQAAAYESNSLSTFCVQDANLQITGLNVPNFDYNRRSSNPSSFLKNSLPSQLRTSSQHKGDNSVSNSLSYPQPPTSCESNSYVDSTLRIRDANLQINGSKVPNFDSNWRSSNSSPFLLNSLPSQPQASSQYKSNYSIANSLTYSQPAAACEYEDSILRIQDANLHINGLKAPNLDSSWRYSNSNFFLQNPLPRPPQTSYSLPAIACESNSYVDSTFHNLDPNLQINGLNVPHFDSNWRSNSSNQRNQQTGSDFPPLNSSAFLQNTLQVQHQTCSQHKGDNSVSNSLSDSQPTAACESNSYVDSTFRIQDANLQINGLEIPQFDSNWRPSNSNQRNQQTSSDLPPLNSSAFLHNTLQVRHQTCSHHKGDNSVSNSLSDSQPTAACESNSYVDSTFRIQDANLQINGLEIPQFDSNWRPSNSNQINQLSSSDISPQVHDWRRQIYDPCFPSGTTSGSLGFVTEPWMLDESLCPMSPELNAYPRPNI